MTIRARLLLAAAPLALALVLLGVFAVRSISFLGHTSEAILAENYRSVLAAQRMKEALERLDSAVLYVALGHRDEGMAQIAPHRKLFEDELGVEEGNLTEPGEPELVARARSAWEQYQRELDGCLALADENAVEDCYFRELGPRFQALKAGAQGILALNQDAMVRTSENARTQSERVGAAMLVAAIAALALGLLASWGLASRTLRPLTALGLAVEQFGRGDLAVRAHARGGAEVAQLAHTFNAMADRIEEYRRSSLGEMLQQQLAVQAALNALPDPVVVFAGDGALQNANRAAEALLGPDAGPAPRLDALAPALREVVERVRAHVLSGKGAYVPRGFEEAITVEQRGEERSFLPRAEPIYEEEGGVVGVTVVLQDITRWRRFDELRQDVVSTVAHQFRTPLTSLRMAIHLCLEGQAGPLTAKQKDLLYASREECERLQSMVDELLDLARLQSGAPLDLAEADAAALLERAEHASRASAAAKSITLLVEPVDGALAVHVDLSRIDLVFANLIENAIRHTKPEGRVVLRARRADGDVRFEVEDGGPGIAPEDQPRVFERFYRGAGGGTGLGLAIARDAVRAHGGAIGVEAAPGAGSVFWFTLPCVSPGVRA